MADKQFKQAYDTLSDYIKQENYKGWDPFDGLNSRIFRHSPFYKSRILRLAWIQFFKRSSINLRKISLVPKGYNAKGLGLFASGLATLGKLDEAKQILDVLEEMACTRYAGNSWGYNFDWQARAFYVPTGRPNMVTTVFVANAFLESTDYADYTDSNAKEYLELVKGACEFILKELILFEDENKLCFGYIPGEDARVHNANMLGAALLARVYSHTKKREYLEKSKKAIAYSVKALDGDYSWPYGELQHHRFIDNFHTGFNLVALKDWMDYTGENIWEEELNKAY